MSTWIFALVFSAIGGFGGGYAAWKIKRNVAALDIMVRKAAGDAGAARAANSSLAGDIDDINKRFDGVYAELEKHEKTFAKSRKSRKIEKVVTAPKSSNGSSVNHYMTEGGA